MLGVVLLIVSPGGFGVEGFGLSAGAGSSVLMLNFLFRLGVAGDKEREREEDARRYLAEHGQWPDEPARTSAPQQAQPEPGHAARTEPGSGISSRRPVLQTAGRQPAVPERHQSRHPKPESMAPAARALARFLAPAPTRLSGPDERPLSESRPGTGES